MLKKTTSWAIPVKINAQEMVFAQMGNASAKLAGPYLIVQCL